MKIKGWELHSKGRMSTIWMKSDGIPGGIGNATKYPFVVVSKNSQGWNVQFIRYSSENTLGTYNTRVHAEKVAVNYMKKYTLAMNKMPYDFEKSLTENSEHMTNMREKYKDYYKKKSNRDELFGYDN